MPQNWMWPNYALSGGNLQQNYSDQNNLVPTTLGQKIAVTDSVVTSGVANLLDFSMMSNPVTPSVMSVSTTTAVSKPICSVPGPKATTSISSNMEPVSVTLESACLAFVRSEMLRVDHRAVIDTVSKSFGLDEIKASREILFRNTGSKSYRYMGPQDPATAMDKVSHCVTSIVMKMHELDQQTRQFKIKYLCSADDLFRLMNLSGKSNDKLEGRVSVLETELKKINSKLSSSVNPSAPHSSNPGRGRWPAMGEPTDRLNLIKVFNSGAASSPKRKRMEDSSGNSRWLAAAQVGANLSTPLAISFRSERQTSYINWCEMC